jgi:hypothetical protein
MQIQHEPRKPGLASLERLFNDLVPPSGRAPTIQGELVRAINNIGHEYESNGNCNWEVSRASFSGQLRFLQEHLLKGLDTSSNLHRALGVLELAGRDTRFADEKSTEIHQAISVVKLAVRQWCHRNPEPLKR